jgi:hypothetical protein
MFQFKLLLSQTALAYQVNICRIEGFISVGWKGTQALPSNSWVLAVHSTKLPDARGWSLDFCVRQMDPFNLDVITLQHPSQSSAQTACPQHTSPTMLFNPSAYLHWTSTCCSKTCKMLLSLHYPESDPCIWKKNSFVNINSWPSLNMIATVLTTLLQHWWRI